MRWQVELAFKRMKSILDLGRLPAKNPDLARAWLYAHLLFALLIDTIAAPQGDFPPEPAKPQKMSIWRLTAFIAAVLKAAISAKAKISTLFAAIPKINRNLNEPPRRRTMQSLTIPYLS
jgi:Transposase DDE domain